MTALAVVRLELEVVPVVCVDVDDGERVSLDDWLDRHPEQREPIGRAVEIDERLAA